MAVSKELGSPELLLSSVMWGTIFTGLPSGTWEGVSQPLYFFSLVPCLTATVRSPKCPQLPGPGQPKARN